jgi:hypothetical protein
MADGRIRYDTGKVLSGAWWVKHSASERHRRLEQVGRAGRVVGSRDRGFRVEHFNPARLRAGCQILYWVL